MTPASYQQWRLHLQNAGPMMSDVQMEACARLVTVLLCGEQSALLIFSAEVKRGRAPEQALNALRSIEFDEQLHEQALSDFSQYLPVPDDLHAVKRRAQRFFAGLGRISDMARHFGQISYLDSAVCKIMFHIERSSIDSLSPLRQIAGQIKKDEVRHVSVSRNYAASLGLKRSVMNEDGFATTEGLIHILEPVTASFETVGVDSDKLFAHIRRAGSV